MPKRKRTSKRRSRSLTLPERDELLIGCEEGESHFADDEDRREAWDIVRAEMLGHCFAGCRPWAYWRYDATEAPGGEERAPQFADEAAEIFEAADREERDQLRYLAENGLLAPQEVVTLRGEAAGSAASDLDRERAAIVAEHATPNPEGTHNHA